MKDKFIKKLTKIAGIRLLNGLLVLVMVCGLLLSQAPESAYAATLLSANFDADASGFIYADDSFRNTAQPGFADGAWLPGGGYAGGGLQVSLGGVDGATVYGMSGGWRSSFTLVQATTVTVSVRYKLTLSADSDSTDFSQVLLSVDGVRRSSGSNSYVAQLTGDGDGGSNQTTNWQQVTVSLGALPAGEHVLVVGGYLSQKTGTSEWAEVLVDDVVVDGTTTSATERVDYGTAVSGYHGAVATGGSNASSTAQAGIRILREGGNAFDAAGAMILALTTNDSGMVCFGGEVPIITYNKALDQVKVISGQGPTPALGTLAYFQSIGGIPSGTNIKNAAVPGLLLGVLTMLKDHGSMTFEQVADPFLDLLAGQTGWRADLRTRLQQMIAADVNARAGGGSREDGLQAVRDLFYSGAIADEIDARSVAQGGLIRKSDLVAYGGSWAPIEDPLSIDYKGHTVYKVGAWTQGPYALETLQILEGMNLQAMGHLQTDYIHAVVEALKLGLADRDEYLADPNYAAVPLPNMISQEYADLRRTLIDMGEASLEWRPGDPWNMEPLMDQPVALDRSSETTGISKDTSTVVTADRWGNVVVATPSGWGGVLLSGTGIYLGNRLRSLNTWEGHPNVVEPGKRPRITLTPGLIFKDGRPYVGISVAGTDKQDQTFTNLFLNAIEFGFSAAESVSLPRFGTEAYYNSFGQAAPDLGSLTANSSIPSAIRSALAARGHEVTSTSSAYASPNMIIFHEDGLLEAAGDPNASRYAGAYTDLTEVIANNPPTADPQSVSTNEDTAKAIILTGSDPDNDPITFVVTVAPAHGSLNGTAPNLTYTPDANYSGSDSFQFIVNDGLVDSATATVAIEVTPVNDAPVADNQMVSLVEDSSVAITLAGSDVDGDNLAYIVMTDPAHGTLSGAAPNMTYTPSANYSGSDSFTFKVNDGQVDSALAEVSITVTPVNDAPVADAQSDSTSEDTAVSVTLTGSDVEGGDLTYSVVSGPAHGALSGTAPNLTYTPSANYNGSDSFTFKVNDGQADSATAEISITVLPVNDAPVANLQSVTTTQDTPLAVTLTGSDVDGDSLIFSVVIEPANGALSGSAPNLTYTPNAGFIGSDSFTFIANDGQVDSTPATVSITVNDSGLYIGSSTSGTAGGIAFNDEDILVKNLSSGAWELYLDGSDVGLSGTDVDAFELQTDGSLLMSFDTAFTLTNFGSVDDSDILRFVPTSLGDVTAGAWQWYFDGSDVGLSNSDEDVDAFTILADGRLLISTLGNVSVTGVSGVDEDLLAFTPTQLGATTSGTWTMYFDGSDVGLSSTSNEDVNGVWVDAAGKIYLTTLGNFSVTGVSGDGSDIFTCTPGSLGSTTRCTFAMYWDGSANGFSGEVTDSFGIVP